MGRVEISIPEQVVIDENCELENNVRLRAGGAWKNATIKIGRKVFLGHSTQINVGSDFQIGENCLIAPSCIFTDARHEFEDPDKPIIAQQCTYRSIIVQDDVWIGSGSIILAGVTIGSGAIIGAGSVVTRDIPSFEIWAGVPAKRLSVRIKGSNENINNFSGR